MITDLTFGLTFPNGRTLSGRHGFEPGMTVIAGPNGQGKSTRLEMIRYALFGSAALRGTTDDYAQIDVALTFRVHDRTFFIKRSLKAATLSEAEDTLASGQKAVTAKVQEILGYDLRVFDIANCAQQGEIAALSVMAPSDRKRMVDQVVGLDILESLMKMAQGRAREATAAAAAIILPLVPAPPLAPEGLRPVLEIDFERTAVRDRMTAIARLEALLASPPATPTHPADPEIPETVAELERYEDGRIWASKRVIGLTKDLASIPEATMTEAEIAAERELAAALAFLAKDKRPEHCQTSLRVARAGWAAWERYGQWKNLRQHGDNCCPACGHTWPKMADQMEHWGDFSDPASIPSKPSMTLREIEQAELAWRLWEANSIEREDANETLLTSGAVGAPREVVDAAERALYRQDERARLTAELAEMTAKATLPDRSADLTAKRAYEAEMAAYRKAAAVRDEWTVRAVEWSQRLGELQAQPHLAADLAALDQLRDAVVAYEAERRTWEAACAASERATEVRGRHQAEADRWNRAKDALGKIRIGAKNYLIPALNRVASILLAKITGGVLTSVEVDEDFDVRIAGQRLATLSGSEKTAVNLALRIALGQLLTNRVFSVFMGDEVDADMDDERSARTAETIRSLSSMIGQVIVVSHKRIEADHHLDL